MSALLFVVHPVNGVVCVQRTFAQDHFKANGTMGPRQEEKEDQAGIM